MPAARRGEGRQQLQRVPHPGSHEQQRTRRGLEETHGSSEGQESRHKERELQADSRLICQACDRLPSTASLYLSVSLSDSVSVKYTPALSHTHIPSILGSPSWDLTMLTHSSYPF